MLRQTSMSYDADVERKSLRVVDLHKNDEHSANMRCERARQRDHPKCSELGFLCDAHKRAQTLGFGSSVLKPLDSRIIRIQLSLKGCVRNFVKREMRHVIREQLVVVMSGAPSVDADDYRKSFYKLVLGRDVPQVAYKRAIVDKLFNGDIRKRGVIEHYERGCCASPAETLKLMVTVGVDALTPDRFYRVLQRKNWTGADVCVDELLLPSGVHGIFDAAYLRSAAKETKASKRAGELKAQIDPRALQAIAFPSGP
jgi:hypothetical protein